MKRLHIPHVWMLVIRDTRDAGSAEPLSEAGFRTATEMRAFLNNYMAQFSEFVSEYWIYQDGEELEHVSE